MFVALDAHRPCRCTKATDRRTARDFAAWTRWMGSYAESLRVQIAADNLATHTTAALYETFPQEEARRLLRHLDFLFIPKHASWLNMVEIEIGVLAA